MNTRRFFLIGRVTVFATLLATAGATWITVANDVNPDQQSGHGHGLVAANISPISPMTPMPSLADTVTTKR